MCVSVHPVAWILWQTAVHLDRQAFQRWRKSALESTVMNASCCEQSFRETKPHPITPCTHMQKQALGGWNCLFSCWKISDTPRRLFPPGAHLLLYAFGSNIPGWCLRSWDALSERCPTLPSCHSIFSIRPSPLSLFCPQKPLHVRRRALLIHSSSLSCWRPRTSLYFRAIIIYSLPQPWPYTSGRLKQSFRLLLAFLPSFLGSLLIGFSGD